MKRLITISMLLLVAACGYAFQHKPIDTSEAELMPEAVAKQILLAYFSREWVELPFASCCNLLGQSGKYPMGYSEISSLSSMAGSSTSVYFGNRVVHIKEIPSNDLPKVGLALRSMGAKRITSVTLGQPPTK